VFEKDRVRAHMMGLVVTAAVAEHQPEVCNTLLGTAVGTVVQLFLDGAHIHGMFDDIEIILGRNESENYKFLYTDLPSPKLQSKL